MCIAAPCLQIEFRNTNIVELLDSDSLAVWRWRVRDMMGSGPSSLEERMFCCTQNTIYDDQQLSALATYTEQLGLDKKQL